MQIVLTESHRGTVTEVSPSEVVITYETPTGPTQQAYRKEQLMDDIILAVGDPVIFRLTVVRPSR